MRGVASTESEEVWHFSQLQATLEHMELEGAKHKESLPCQVMVWLGFHFDTINMTLSTQDDKLAEIRTLVADWALKRVANIHKLRTILGKLFYIAQCCSPTKSIEFWIHFESAQQRGSNAVT